MDNNWVDTSIDEIAEHLNYFGKTSEIEELMMSYMHCPLVMSVCQKWNNFAEKNPTKMRSYNVDEMRMICYERNTFRISIQEIVGEDNQNIVKSQTLRRTNVFEHIKFLAPRHLQVISQFEFEAEHFLVDIPSWWKLNVEKTTISFKRPNANGFRLSFTISDFHLLKLTNISSDDPLPYVNEMVSLQELNYYGRCLESDKVLDAISTRSKCFKKICISASFSSETLINFFKKGSFDSVVKVQFDKLSDGSGGKNYLENFITSHKDYHIETDEGSATFLRATFTFRETHFTLTIDEWID